MRTLAFLVILGVVFANNNKNILLQKPDRQVFEEVFSELSRNQKPGDFGYDLYTQLKEKVNQGGDLSDVQDHIVVLKNHLQTDQNVDDEFYNTEKQRNEVQVEELGTEIHNLKEEEIFLEEKIQVLNSQSNIIDTLFSQDSEAYAERVGTQQAMLSTLESLVEKIENNLVEASSLIQKSDLFETLKKIGKGKHIEVLAQITLHLDQNQITVILDLFHKLEESIKQSIEQDSQKEQDNIRLHNSLRAEIGQLIPQTDTRLGEVLDQLEDSEAQHEQLEQRLATLHTAYEERTEHRNIALTKTNDAHKLLENNMDRLAKWEDLVADKPQ